MRFHHLVALVVCSWLSVICSPSAFAQKCLAPDFKVELVYSVPEIEHPSVVACDDEGNLFVGEDPMDMRGPTKAEFDRVLLIKFGPDGKPVRKTVFCDKLSAVFGLIWHDGALYVMHAPHYSVFRDTDGDGVADERKDLADGFGPPAGVYGFNDHIVTGTRLGLDGRVYVSVGDKGVPKAVGSDGSAITLEGGGVIRMKLDGSQLEVVSSGTRNHLDVAMDSLDNIFSYDNTDDGLGWWTRFTHHVPTGYYGYPYDYLKKDGAGQTLALRRHLPRLSEHGGGSPVGAACYREAAWPATYVDSPFFCEWGKQKVQRFKLKKKGASFEAEIEDFLVKDDSSEPFRPLDLNFSPDGKHMYLADWNFNGWVNPAVKGRLYRVTYVGNEPAVKNEPPRAPKDASIEQLVASLGHPSHAERMKAQFAIAKQPANAVVRELRQVITTKDAAPQAKVHAIWAMHALATASPDAPQPAELHWDEALKDSDPSVRAQAVRAIGLRRGDAYKLHALLSDADPTVRLQTAVALGRYGDRQADAKWKSTDSGQPGVIVPRESETQLSELQHGCEDCAIALAKALGDEDEYVQHAVIQALRVINHWLDFDSALTSANPRVRAAAILTLTGVYDEEAIKGLRDVALNGSTEDRARAIEGLAEVHRRAAPYVKGWWGTRPAAGKPVRPKNQDWSGTSTVASTLRAVMEGDSPLEAKLAVIKAWRDVNDPAALPLLRLLAQATDKADVAVPAVVTLATLKDKESMPLFAKIASDDKCSEELRREAVKGISEIGSPQAVKQLIEIVSDEKTSPELVGLALEALGKLKNAEAAPAIEKRLADQKAAVRIAAIEAFGAVRGADSAARIAELLKDSDVSVKKAAIKELGRSIGVLPISTGKKNEKVKTPKAKKDALDEDARAALVSAIVLAANDPAVKFEAQMSLAQIVDRRALGLYLDGLASPNQELRNTCLNALTALRPQIGDDILTLHQRNELPAKVRGSLQQVFSAPAPLSKWSLLGSFPKSDKDKLPTFDRTQAPDLSALHHVGERAVKWKSIEVTDKDGHFDLMKFVDGPKNDVWAFAYTTVESDSEGPRSFVVGSDDQLAVHINGEKVYEFTGNRGWSNNSGSFTATLKAGANHIWLQLGNDGAGFDFSVGMSGRDPKYAFLFENATPMLDIGAFRDFAMKKPGNAAKGKTIFDNPQGVGCIKCHAVSGTGGKVGPDLVGIGARYPKDELIRSILEPSARIANGFDTGIVETKDGKVFTGVLKIDSPEAVELLAVDGKTIRIPADDIEEKTRSPLSTMPNGLKDGLTLQDFADIVAYLESLKQSAEKQ